MISSFLGTACLVSLLIPILCVMTYVACAAVAWFPLRSGALASFDEGLGFRWTALLAWADGHAAWADIGRIAYRSWTRRNICASDLQVRDATVSTVLDLRSGH